MGVGLKELIHAQSATLEQFNGKTIAVDAYNTLYQFLTSIRSYDGTLLTNSKGHVTSHLQGLFARLCALKSKNINMIYVFDGKPPQLKQQTLDARKKVKQAALEKYEKALQEDDLEGMQQFSRQTAKLTPEMADQAKDLLRAFGVPVLQAPQEGEAQAAVLCQKGDADFVATQDADALVFGSPQVVRNLSTANKRKMPGKRAWTEVEPQILTLTTMLEELQITHDQLIYIAMLVGTDYAPGGIKGIGPKKALKLVKQAQPEEFFKDWQQEASWQTVFDALKNPVVKQNYTLTQETYDREKLTHLLINTYEFSTNRVQKSLDELDKNIARATQKGLGDFF